MIVGALKLHGVSQPRWLWQRFRLYQIEVPERRIGQLKLGAPPLRRGGDNIRQGSVGRYRYAADMIEVEIASADHFSSTLAAATKLPGVRIHRADYLRKALRRECTPEQVRRAVDSTPAGAGIDTAILRRAAAASIRWETSKVATISGATGLPGGFTMIAAVPADLAQYFGHMLRIAQKLAYLYSWPDLFDSDGDEIDDGTKAVLTLFLGVMFGVQSANVGIGKLATLVSQQIAKKLPQKALTKGTIYPIVKKVAAALSVQMTKQTFARGIAKVVPVIGGIVSAGVTVATFTPMANRLRRHFAGLELASPHTVATTIEEHGDTAVKPESPTSAGI